MMRHSPSFYKKISDMAGHGQIVLDDQEKIVLWNHWMEKSSPYAAEEVFGKKLEEVFKKGLPKRLNKAVEHALVSGRSSLLSSAFTPHPFPLKHPYDQRLKMTQRVMVRAFRDENNDRFCFIDITDVSLSAHREHKLREQSDALADTSQQLSLILDGVSEAVISTDSMGRIITINNAGVKLFGVTELDARDTPLAELLPALPQPRPGEIVRLEVQGAYGSPRGIRKQGVLSIAVNYPEEGSTPTWVINDVTAARRQQDELLKAKQMAEAASEQKSNFLANMSHEVRTPMNGVLGMAELLMDTNLNMEQRDYAATIRKSGELLLNIINDLLDFSKIDAGKTELVHLQFNLPKVIEEVVSLLSVKAHQKKLEIAWFCPYDGALDVMGDPYRLRQILMNLVNNAVKFTEQGVVTVTLEVSEEAGEGVVVNIIVEDTGVGIHPSDRSKLFNPFTQADSSSTRRFGGTGLGLAICKRLAELMGGGITFDSEPQRGSRFVFSVPLKRCEQQSSHERIEGLADVRALIISDFQVNRRFAAEQLGYLGVSSKGITPEEALKLLPESGQPPYDLIFLDYNSTCARAEQACSAILQRGFSNLIQMTPRLQRKDFANTPHLHKPFKLHELSHVLSQYFKRTEDQPTSLLKLGELAMTSRTINILLVEDNLINQKVLTKMLAKLKCHVKLADNGKAALDMLAHGDFDLVFMDCQMPEMDGYEATRMIRERERGTGLRMPIVAMTAHALRGDRDKCLAAGMDDYMSKPVKHEQLATMLKKWTHQEAVVEAASPQNPTEDP